ncbi:MAG: electron transport complex subunit RsxC [Coriobacteriia bacterium]|nr:electron transport complex subunit RsxC [Coriobacteriia bacterium]MBN2840739.1 electron transport complex subunit RsxC [Coriobacteriia bacterium]
MGRSVFAGGVHPPGHKESTAGSPVQWAPVPARLVVPLSQHLGAPCAPVVGKGDRVERGQVIGDVDAMVSAPIHSPVAGTVAEIGTTLVAGGQRVAAVIIEPDEVQDLASFVPIEASDDPRACVRAAGVVGMGGATFPSTVKLTPPKGMAIDTVILNGCECEPFLTCDHRLMLEEPERVVAGAVRIREMIGAKRVIIALEDNKPDAAAALRAAAADGIEVTELPTRYPQGAEKQLIYALLKKEVPHGKLPAATGALVHNVATAVAIADALESGKPLTERIVTVTGAVARPGNYRVVIGTLVSDLIEHAGGLVGEVERVISGGPMTGMALGSLEVPITKGSSGIVALPKGMAAPAISDDQPCIRCGRCPAVCPMGLEPYILATYAGKRMWDAAAERNVIDCIECGACSYVCPTKRPLLQLIRVGKSAAMSKGAK